MKKNILIGLIGETGAGKRTFAEMLDEWLPEGMERFATLDLRVDASDAPFVLLGGVFRQSDFDFVRRRSPSFLVYVTAPARLRWKRVVALSENPGDAALSFGEFVRREKASPACEIARLGGSADCRIDNDSPRGYLEADAWWFANEIARPELRKLASA